MLTGSGSHGASEVGWVEEAAASEVNVVPPRQEPQRTLLLVISPATPGLLKRMGSLDFSF